jgi:hypothetical protein
MSPIVHTLRFQIIQAYQAWLKTGAATYDEPKLFATKVKYTGSDEWRPLYFIRRTDDGDPEMVVDWNRAINTLYARVEDFDFAARQWQAARA